MDARLEAVLAQQMASGLPGLSGSEATTAIRLSDQLLNQIIAAALPAGGAVRTLTLHACAGNVIETTITLAKPAFLPALHPRFSIEGQPSLPANPVLTLRVTGGAATLIRLAGPYIASSLPPGVRLNGDLVQVDVRVLMESQGQAMLFGYVRDVRVTTEESIVVIAATCVVAPAG